MSSRHWLMVSSSILLACQVNASPDVTSREYKIMLDVHRFDYASEAQVVDEFLGELKDVIARSIDRSTSGQFALAKQREVSFFDVEGSCILRESGYSYRERIDGSKTSVSLKVRSPDRYIVGFEDVSSDNDSAESKFELDVGMNRHEAFRSIFSASTKYRSYEEINDIGHINDQFAGFKKRYDYDDAIPLSRVSNLQVTEHVYRGFEVDLGKFDAEFDLTLWYDSEFNENKVPVVAEISFGYEDSKAGYSRNVVRRSKALFEEMQKMGEWIDPDSQTKTSFVYNYDSNFCQPETQQGAE